MIVINYSASKMVASQPILLGKQMENNHRQFVFDCSDFGDVVSVTLVHQRSQDIEPYIVASNNSDTVTWTVTNTDTAYDGIGHGELRISFADGLAKSVVFTTSVIKSITADTTIPEPLQSWYDAMIAYINDHSVTDDQLAEAIADYMAEHPVTAPVQSVNAKTGDVVLTASDVGAVSEESDPVFTASPAHGISSADIESWNGKSDFSGSYNDLTDKPTIPVLPANIVNTVNGQTGDVTIEGGNSVWGQITGTLSNQTDLYGTIMPVSHRDELVLDKFTYKEGEDYYGCDQIGKLVFVWGTFIMSEAVADGRVTLMSGLPKASVMTFGYALFRNGNSNGLTRIDVTTDGELQVFWAHATLNKTAEFSFQLMYIAE